MFYSLKCIFLLALPVLKEYDIFHIYNANIYLKISFLLLFRACFLFTLENPRTHVLSITGHDLRSETTITNQLLSGLGRTAKFFDDAEMQLLI